MRESERISVLKGVGENRTIVFIKQVSIPLGTCLRIRRTYDIYEDPISIGEIQEGRQSLSPARSSGQVSQNKNADHHTLSERHDRHFESDLVSIRSSQYTGTGRRDHSARKDCAKGRTGDGASGFSIPVLLRGKRNTMQPVYALTAGLTNNAVKSGRSGIGAGGRNPGISSGRADLPISPSWIEELQWKESISRDKEESMKQESALYLKNF